jgi:hypothetical protein
MVVSDFLLLSISTLQCGQKLARHRGESKNGG